MNKQEIINAARQAADDIRDINAFAIKRQSVMELLRTTEEQVSPIVQWHNAETDKRCRVLLAGLIRLLAVTYRDKPEANDPATAEQINRLCDRLEKMISPTGALSEGKSGGRDHSPKPYPQPKKFGRDQFIWENICTMSMEQLIQAIKSKKNFGLDDGITTSAGFKRAALRYSQYHELPTRNFQCETPYSPTDTD